MSSVLTPEVLEQDAGIVVSGTGEFLPAIEPNYSSGLQADDWARDAIALMRHMDQPDDVRKAQATLRAAAALLKQMGEDQVPVRWAEIYSYKRLGELLPKPKRGNPTGKNQYTSGILQHEKIPPKTQGEMKEAWISHKIDDNWDIVESLKPKIKKPSLNAVLREIKRLTSRMESPPVVGAASLKKSNSNIVI